LPSWLRLVFFFLFSPHQKANRASHDRRFVFFHSGVLPVAYLRLGSGERENPCRKPLPRWAIFSDGDGPGASTDRIHATNRRLYRFWIVLGEAPSLGQPHDKLLFIRAWCAFKLLLSSGLWRCNAQGLRVGYIPDVSLPCCAVSPQGTRPVHGQTVVLRSKFGGLVQQGAAGLCASLMRPA